MYIQVIRHRTTATATATITDEIAQTLSVFVKHTYSVGEVAHQFTLRYPQEREIVYII
jgi:hypothetical protein